jgi:PAS domain S-box-containing protein
MSGRTASSPPGWAISLRSVFAALLVGAPGPTCGGGDPRGESDGEPSVSTDADAPLPPPNRAWLAGFWAETDDCLYLKDAEGRYVDANAATAEALGCGEKEVIGYTDFDFFPRPQAETIKAIDRRVLDGEHIRLREEIDHVDGGRRIFLTRKLPWTDGDGHVIGIAGVSTDITDSIATRDALAESEARFRTIFEEAPIGKAVVALDGSWLEVNPALATLTGYTADQLIAGRAEDITHPDDVDADLALLRDLLDRRRRSYEIDKRYVRANGDILWVHQTVALVRNDDGSPRYFIYQVRDITERIESARQLQEALTTAERANAELRRADELKDHLLTITTHELRTPLTSVLGFAQLLASRYDTLSDIDRREAASIIERQSRRLDQLISDVLTLSHFRAGELVPRAHNVPVVDVRRQLQERYPDLIVDGADELVVHADPHWLVDILSRIVENAFRHGQPPVRVEVATGDTGIVFSVEDQGPGVPAEFVPQLFETFTQADTGIRRRTSGVGLGLAVVAEVAAAMHGEVWYETGSNGGARVCVRLPTGG